MRRFTQSVLAVLVAVLSFATVSAQQGQYKIAFDAVSQTYTVYGKVNTSYTTAQSKFVNVFVTIMATHGTGTSRFVPSNITTAAALATSNVMTLNRLDGPSYQLTKDYLMFNFDVGSLSYTQQAITANTEFPIFSFQSQNGCTNADLYILVHGSAEYDDAQANGQNASNAFSILGAGSDTYTSNYGSTALCLPVPATVSAAYTPNPMTAGTNGLLTLTATNSAGNPAQSGMGYTYTLPAGMSFPAGVTPTNSCGGTATVSGNMVTFSGGTMASGLATCTVTVPVVAAASGTIDPSTATLSNLTNVTAAPNNGAGTTPTPITVNPASATCAANAGTLGY